jgi:lipopolysaccharide transport protein LptA
MFIRILILICIFIPNIILAEKTSIKTDITSEKIIMVKNKNFIEFQDNVILTREDISFLSNKMQVFTSEISEKDKKMEIKIIKAKDKVKIFNQEFIATGNSGIYDVKKGIFNIFGNVILNEGTKIAYGDKFTYNIANRKGFLSSDNKENNRPTIIINENLDNLKKELDENSNN